MSESPRVADPDRFISWYKAHYGISVHEKISLDQILTHWRLEKQLASEIMASSSDTRWQTVEKAYTTLYEQLHWLNVGPGAAGDFRSWLPLIGDVPKKVLEIGPGAGGLIKFLADAGHSCTASEITSQRGSRDDPRISWVRSDGVHLSKFFPPASFDVLISDQVIEHLHPNDLEVHFDEILKVLKKGGKYVFRTPHRWFGPCDVSLFFDTPVPLGMHLKEYTYRELVKCVRRTGFSQVKTVMYVPSLGKWIKWKLATDKTIAPPWHTFESRVFTVLYCILETVLGRFLCGRRLFQKFRPDAQVYLSVISSNE